MLNSETPSIRDIQAQEGFGRIFGRGLFLMRLLFLGLLFLGSHAGAAPQGQGDGQWAPAVRTEKPLPGLSWKNSAVNFEWGQDKGQTVPIAKVRGVLNTSSVPSPVKGGARKKDTLMLNNRVIPVASDGAFEFRIPVVKNSNLYRVFIVQSAKSYQSQTFQLVAKNLENWKKLHPAPSPKSHFFTVSLGPSMLSYKETLSPDFSQMSLVLKVAYFYQLKNPRWNLGMNFFVTALPLSSNQAGIHVRNLGVNARVGYVIPGISEPWRFTIMAGTYFSTMSVTDSSFGYNRLMGPQLFPALRRSFKNGDSVSGYLKFSPVGCGILVQSLSNHELATGLSWSRPIKGKGQFSVSLDLATLELEIDGIAIKSQSASLGVGYSW